MIATFTLAARDPKTGMLAIITTSNYLAVGSLVPHIDSAAGIVVTQSFANPAAAISSLSSLRAGRAPKDVIDDFLINDDMTHLRQVGVMNLAGEVAIYNGKNCTQTVESIADDNFMVLGNTLIAGTCQAIASSFTVSRESGVELGTAMVDAMLAGQKVGGDRRGKLAASLLMKNKAEEHLVSAGSFVDLRVDAAAQPLEELRDLYGLFKLYNPEQFSHEMIPVQTLSTSELQLINTLLATLSKADCTEGAVTIDQPIAAASLLAEHNLARNFDAHKGLISSLLLSETSSLFRLAALRTR